ncbi:hypothetical protein ACHAW6_016109 [Cyclotella cf. meneghiniana]
MVFKLSNIMQTMVALLIMHLRNIVTNKTRQFNTVVGIAERAIRDITDNARTMQLHAKARWSSPVHLCL